MCGAQHLMRQVCARENIRIDLYGKFSNGDRVKKSQWILGLVALLALAALVFWARSRIHFDFHVFDEQVARADWGKIVLAVVFISVSYLFRGVRWALLMRHNKKVPLFSLIGVQVIGFTAVALIGRVADPVRPYLVAKKTSEPLGSQMAVYIVERLFDFGTMALLFRSLSCRFRKARFGRRPRPIGTHLPSFRAALPPLSDSFSSLRPFWGPAGHLGWRSGFGGGATIRSRGGQLL